MITLASMYQCTSAMSYTHVYVHYTLLVQIIFIGVIFKIKKLKSNVKAYPTYIPLAPGISIFDTLQCEYQS